MAETSIRDLVARLIYLEQKLRESSALLSRTPGHERGLRRHALVLRELRQRVDRLERRTKSLGDQAGVAQQEVFGEELTRLATRLDRLWADLNAEVQEVREQLSLQGESVARAHDRLDAAFGQNDEKVVTREWVTQQVGVGSGKFPAWGFLLALVVGILVMFATAGPWTLSGPVFSHGGKVVGTFAANFHGARWGVVVGLVAAGLVILIVSLFPARQGGSSRVSRSVRSIRRRRARGPQASQQQVVPITDLLKHQKAAK